MKLKKGVIIKITNNKKNHEDYRNHVFYISRIIKQNFYECKILDVPSTQKNFIMLLDYMDVVILLHDKLKNDIHAFKTDGVLNTYLKKTTPVHLSLKKTYSRDSTGSSTTFNDSNDTYSSDFEELTEVYSNDFETLSESYSSNFDESSDNEDHKQLKEIYDRISNSLKEPLIKRIVQDFQHVNKTDLDNNTDTNVDTTISSNYCIVQ